MIEFITNNPEISGTILGALFTGLIFVADYIVKYTDNKADDAFWFKYIREPFKKIGENFIEGLNKNEPVEKRTEGKENITDNYRRKEDDLKIEIKEDIEPTETGVK